MPVTLSDRPARIALVECSIQIAASRKRCFRAFFRDVEDWFYESEESRKTRPARIEPKLGGRFFIESDNGDRNLLANVTLIKRNREIRLRGDFTIPHAFIANVTIRFEDASPPAPPPAPPPPPEGSAPSSAPRAEDADHEDQPSRSTRISITHRMSGEFDDDLPKGFHEGWLDGLNKLKALVESKD